MEELLKKFAEIMEKKTEAYARSLASNNIDSDEHKQVKVNIATEAGEEFKKISLKMFEILDVLYKTEAL